MLDKTQYTMYKTNNERKCTPSKHKILADMKHFGCPLKVTLTRCRISASTRRIKIKIRQINALHGLNRSIYYKFDFQYQAHV